MTVKHYIKTVLLLALVVLSLGGWLLHLRIHSFAEHSFGWVPFTAGILSIIVVPLLYLSKKTLAFGYVLNSMIVIVATITMAHFSFTHPPEGPITVAAVLLNTTLADILIVWSKFFVGKALFDLEVQGYNTTAEKKGKGWRYPHVGWWVIHLAAMSFVYWVGTLLKG
jgi:hypothetical protein